MIVKEVCVPCILTKVNLKVEVIYPMQKITRTCSWRLIKTLIIGGDLEPYPMNLFLMKRSIIENDGLGVCHVEVWETTL